MEDLRNLYAEKFLSLGEAFQRGIAPALMRTEIDYLAPVRFPDTVTGRMWMAEHGRVKYVLAAEFDSAATRQVVARARQTGAFVGWIPCVPCACQKSISRVELSFIQNV